MTETMTLFKCSKLECRLTQQACVKRYTIRKRQGTHSTWGNAYHTNISTDECVDCETGLQNVHEMSGKTIKFSKYRTKEQPYKICTKCKRKLPFNDDYFYRIAQLGIRFRSSCKECDRRRVAENRKKKPVNLGRIPISKKDG